MYMTLTRNSKEKECNFLETGSFILYVQMVDACKTSVAKFLLLRPGVRLSALLVFTRQELFSDLAPVQYLLISYGYLFLVYMMC